MSNIPKDIQDKVYEYAKALYGVEYPGDNDIQLVNAFVTGYHKALEDITVQINKLKITKEVADANLDR